MKLFNVFSKIACASAFAVILSGGFTAAHAQLANGAATTYNVTVNQVELCSSASCNDAIVLGGGASQFDIASAAVGGQLGSYASLDAVPKGRTISHVRVTMSRTLGIAGSTADPGGVGGTCGTNNADNTSSVTAAGVGSIGGGGTVQNLVVPNELAFFGAQPPAGTYAAVNVTLTSATEMTTIAALSAPFTMDEEPPVVDVAFGTSAGLQAFNNGGACGMLPGPPSVTITVQ